jgi:hypothetical protein
MSVPLHGNVFCGKLLTVSSLATFDYMLFSLLIYQVRFHISASRTKAMFNLSG